MSTSATPVVCLGERLAKQAEAHKAKPVDGPGKLLMRLDQDDEDLCLIMPIKALLERVGRKANRGASEGLDLGVDDGLFYYKEKKTGVTYRFRLNIASTWAKVDMLVNL